MVPVYPTLQSQLGAIAKEYALPSTVGMILYIITTTPSEDEGSGEPGPRISDDVWRHIWTRVLKSERDEHPATRPKSFGLGLGLSTGSSPALLQDLTANGHAFRPLVPPRRVETPQPPSSASYPLTPSPSTPSHSAYSSQSEIDTPESASSVDPSSNTLPLPGLNSTSLVPILAKVEFDIDRRKAGWYDPWVRNRKASHAKRAESRLGTRSASRMDSLSSGKASAPEDGVVEGATKKFPFDLELVERLEQSKTPNFLLTTHIAGSISDIESLIDDGDIHRTDELDTDAGYQRLSESPIGGHPLGSEVDPEDDEGEDGAITARPSSNTVADPLADVFGTDEETWQDMHSESSSRRTSKPRVSANIVDLALDAAAISALPESLEEDDEQPDKLSDEQEVSEILQILSRPALAVSIPSSPPSANRRRSSPTTAGTIRKHIPPPLNLVVPSSNNPGLVVQALPSPMPESAGLAYLGDKTPSDVGEFIARSQEAEEPDEPEQQVETQKTQEVAEDPIAVDSNTSPQEEKRGGTIFGELDLGLDPSLETEESGEVSSPFI